MPLTDEQQELIYSTGNAKCIAVAGSGKSTTLFGYARRRLYKKGLYIVYNTSARAEAKAKAKKLELKNLTIHTAHSLAHNQLGIGKKYRVVNKIPLDGIIQVCNITGTDQEKIYTLAQMILDGINIRCNKIGNELHEADYINYDPYTVKKYLPSVIDAVDHCWDEMDAGRVGILHDFYLKKFIVERKADWGFEYVVFDEGQDANEIMLHGFKQQKGTKVIVGDPSQQIYTWRGAINALDKVGFTKYYLTGSHRFGASIAHEANEVLAWKKLLNIYKDTAQCHGLRKYAAPDGPDAFLCRSTVGLFKKMVDLVAKDPQSRLYIEGGLWGNDFLTNNRLLSDIYYLFADQPKKVKGRMVKGFRHIQSLQNFAKNTGNREIGSLIDLVFKYKGAVFHLKDQVIASLVKKKTEASAIFSTVHKAKGQEYATVHLDDTFVTYDDVLKLSEAIHTQMEIFGKLQPDMADAINRMNEEINIRYVAITRAMNKVNL